VLGIPFPVKVRVVAVSVTWKTLFILVFPGTGGTLDNSTLLSTTQGADPALRAVNRWPQGKTVFRAGAVTLVPSAGVVR
jgi:hypothetical protein